MQQHSRSYTKAHVCKGVMAGCKLKGVKVWSVTLCDQRQHTHAGINAWIHPACTAACLT